MLSYRWIGERLTTVILAVLGGAIVLAFCTGGGYTLNFPLQLVVAHADTVNLLHGQWNYLPGGQFTHGKLLIQSRNFKIVEQDGSGGQPNPPVNEYGTRLTIRGAFMVNTELQNIHGPASIQLYSAPPKVSDEFRVEPRSIRLTVIRHMLEVNIWNGQETQDLADQRPIVSQVYAMPGSTSDVRLGVAESGNLFYFTANGVELGSLSDEQLFTGTNQVWFGFAAGGLHDSFSVAKLTATPLFAGALMAVNTAAAPAEPKSPDGLQTLANKARPGFLIGTNVATWAAVSSPSYEKLVFGGNFGIVTPENAMKWQFTEPEPGVFDFREADAIVAMAEKNHMQVHGHNLVFGEALPAWVRNLPIKTPEQKAYLSQVLYTHVYTTVAHFKGRVNQWDINEPFAYYNASGQLPHHGFSNDIFYQALGENYIKIVAQAAVAANPKVQLWVNDYGAENDTGAYWQAVYAALKQWKLDWRLPIYGFGFESHIYNPATDDIANAYDNNGHPILDDHINALAALGLQSRISEADAPLHDPGYAQDNSSQAQQLAGELSICIHNPHCVAFSTWSTGMTDIWQTDNYTLESSVDSMFGLNNLPTGNAYEQVKQVLENF